MEGLSASLYTAIQRYCRRRGYRRLGHPTNTRIRKQKWRIKLPKRFKLNLSSPKRFLIGVRDAYVKMMMRIATTPAIGGDALGMIAVKEYDERSIVEIYKSILVAQGRVVPRDASWICSEMAIRR